MIGGAPTVEVLASKSKWLNVCKFLEEEKGVGFYHRGFPLDQRWSKEETSDVVTKSSVDVVANAGFWFLDPDVDAVQRIVYPVNVVGCTREENFALDKGTWSPFNSQNTSLRREAIPAYFLFPKIGRYDDIWASYIIRRVADEKGQYVTYGAPIVNQERNPHDYFRDENDERLGYTLTPKFCEWLRGDRDGGFRFTQKDYDGILPDLADQLEGVLEKNADESGALVGREVNGKALPLSDAEKAYYQTLIEGCRVWAKTMQRV
mmetsp:Transcript_33980/g.87243  ORF Transcript_33980/g.87243 Transcript_33980/m.87243 type:complete len:262 (-) Transcript_33980:327-1112(-)